MLVFHHTPLWQQLQQLLGAGGIPVQRCSKGQHARPQATRPACCNSHTSRMLPTIMMQPYVGRARAFMRIGSASPSFHPA